jgi:hypothetical protein
MSEFKFSVSDLSLRDCWWIIKRSFIRVFFIGIFFGFCYLIYWGLKVGTESTIGWEPASGIWAVIKGIWAVIKGIWSEIPIWGKITIISVIALLILRESTGIICEYVGSFIKELGDWVEKASFKSRFFLLISIVFFAILFQYVFYLAWGLCIIIWTVSDVFGDLKFEKESIKDKEEWEKEQKEIDKPR